MNDENIRGLVLEVQKNPRNFNSYFNLAMAFDNAGESAKAIRCYEQALRLDPLNQELQNNYALVLVKTMSVEDVCAYLETAARPTSESFALLNNVGNVFNRLGLKEQAVRLYEKALDLKPCSTGVCWNLGKTLEEIGCRAEALVPFRNALRASVKDAAVYGMFDDLEDEYLILSERFGKIEGFLHDLEGYALMMLAEKAEGVGEIVEIGSFMGKSTSWLAAGTKRSGRAGVTAIDHFAGSDEHQAGGTSEQRVLLEEGTTFNRFLSNVRTMGVDGYVTPVIADAKDAVKGWEKQVRLLFIDGDHSYNASKSDFLLWEPFVGPDGYIAFHDIGVWDGVTAFYQEIINSHGEYNEVLSVMSLRVIRKQAISRTAL